MYIHECDPLTDANMAALTLRKNVSNDLQTNVLNQIQQNVLRSYQGLNPQEIQAAVFVTVVFDGKSDFLRQANDAFTHGAFRAEWRNENLTNMSKARWDMLLQTAVDRKLDMLSAKQPTALGKITSLDPKLSLLELNLLFATLPNNAVNLNSDQPFRIPNPARGPQQVVEELVKQTAQQIIDHRKHIHDQIQQMWDVSLLRDVERAGNLAQFKVAQDPNVPENQKIKVMKKEILEACAQVRVTNYTIQQRHKSILEYATQNIIKYCKTIFKNNGGGENWSETLTNAVRGVCERQLGGFVNAKVKEAQTDIDTKHNIRMEAARRRQMATRGNIDSEEMEYFSDELRQAMIKKNHVQLNEWFRTHPRAVMEKFKTYNQRTNTSGFSWVDYKTETVGHRRDQAKYFRFLQLLLVEAVQQVCVCYRKDDAARTVECIAIEIMDKHQHAQTTLDAQGWNDDVTSRTALNSILADIDPPDAHSPLITREKEMKDPVVHVRSYSRDPNLPVTLMDIICDMLQQHFEYAASHTDVEDGTLQWNKYVEGFDEDLARTRQKDLARTRQKDLARTLNLLFNVSGRHGNVGRMRCTPRMPRAGKVQGRWLTLAQQRTLVARKTELLRNLPQSNRNHSNYVWCVANKDTTLYPTTLTGNLTRNRETLHEGSIVLCEALKEDGTQEHATARFIKGGKGGFFSKIGLGTENFCHVYRVWEKRPRDSFLKRNRRLITAGAAAGAAVGAIGGTYGFNNPLSSTQQDAAADGSQADETGLVPPEFEYESDNSKALVPNGYEFPKVEAASDMSTALVPEGFEYPKAGAADRTLASTVGMGALAGAGVGLIAAKLLYGDLDNGQVLTKDLDHCRPVDHKPYTYIDGNILGLEDPDDRQRIGNIPKGSNNQGMMHAMPLSYVYDSYLAVQSTNLLAPALRKTRRTGGAANFSAGAGVRRAPLALTQASRALFHETAAGTTVQRPLRTQFATLPLHHSLLH